jgi:hypothetical protein
LRITQNSSICLKFVSRKSKVTKLNVDCCFDGTLSPRSGVTIKVTEMSYVDCCFDDTLSSPRSDVTIKVTEMSYVDCCFDATLSPPRIN